MVPVSASGGLPSAREDARVTARRSSRCLQGSETLHARTGGRRRPDDHVRRAAPRLRHTDGGGRRASARDPGMDGRGPKTNRRRGNRQAHASANAPIVDDGRGSLTAPPMSSHAPAPTSVCLPARGQVALSIVTGNFRKGCCVRLCQRAIARNLRQRGAPRSGSRSARGVEVDPRHGWSRRPPARWRVRRPGDVAPPRGSFVG
jgi:hypothetical protein